MSNENKSMVVDFGINNNPAQQSVQEIKLDLTNLEAIVERAARSMEASQNKGLASIRRSVQGLAAEQKKMYAEMAAGSQQAQVKQESLAGAILKSNIAMGAISKGIELARQYGEAVKQAADYQHKIAMDLERQIELQGELAAIKGEKANVKFAIDVAKSAKEAGMTPEEMTKFQEQLSNSGQQFVGDKDKAGRTMTTTQAEKFAVDAAKLATARGLPGDVVGDLAGQLVGQHDFASMGEQAGVDEATKRLGRVMAILSAGKGTNTGLLKQQSQTMASLMHEDSLKGVFRSPEDVAKFVSTMAEQNPEEAFTHIKSLQRLIFATEGPEAILKRKAGIKDTDDIPSAMKKLAPVVDEEAKRTNKPIQGVLSKYIPEIKEQESLATVLNRGVGKDGVLAQREEAVKGVDAASVRKEFDDAAKDPNSRVGKRIRNADRTLVEAEKGAKRLPYEAMAQQAETELLRRGEINTGWSNFSDKFSDMTFGSTFGLWEGNKGSKQTRIDEEITRMLEEKNKAAGGNVLSEETLTDLKENAGNENNEARIMAAYDALQKAGQQLGKVAEKMEAAAPAKEPPKLMTVIGPGGGKAQMNR